MCGIAGYVSRINSLETLKNMSYELNHRGPDDSGYWYKQDTGVYLAHQRLSILELSKLGKQPMISASKKIILSYNGEIYNHQEIRKELNSNFQVNWKGNSDTETLINCIEYLGIEKTLDKLIGMFAFSYYDISKNQIILARDRFGEKPIYFGLQNNHFIFASEIRALKKFKNFNFKINKSSLSYFLNYSCIPNNLSIFEDIYKLPQSSYLIYSVESNIYKIYKYWDLKKKISTINTNKIKTLDEYKENIIFELSKSVNLQRISDVPIGCFLSSGIDSSLITSILQSQSYSPIKTFSIGFDDNNYNEAKQSKKIAKYLGTDHHELYINEKDMINLVFDLKNIYSEPFADSSQIPTYFLSKLTSEHVKVVLSGDGADEIFGGYNRHFIANKIMKNKMFLKVPKKLRLLLSNLIRLLSTKQYESFFKVLNYLTSSKIISQNIGDKIYKFAKILPANSIDEIYLLLTTAFDGNNLLKNENKLKNKIFDELEFNSDYLQEFMLRDTMGYLEEDIITKVDRASMHNSLEARMPYLNHNLVEKAFEIPSNLKIHKNNTKYILKSILSNFIPDELISNKKLGFAVPLKKWLTTDLYEWKSSTLDKIRENSEFFNINTLNKIDSDFKNSKYNYEYIIWNILIFQDWYMENK